MGNQMNEETTRTVPVVKCEEAGMTVVADASTQLDLMKKGGGDYLPRLQLQTSNSKDCKSGEFPTNHYAIVRDQSLTDIGTTVDVLVIQSRMQALDFSDDENVISIHDPGLVDGEMTGEFAEIVERSSQSDSKCMWGIQFLVYVPVASTFATVLFGTKTSRRDAPAMLSRVGQAATLGAKKIPNKKFGDYYSMSVLTCSESLQAPDAASVERETEKFLHPPIRVVETAEKAEEGTKQAR
jgi:hypothetical protein